MGMDRGLSGPRFESPSNFDALFFAGLLYALRFWQVARGACGWGGAIGAGRSAWVK